MRNWIAGPAETSSHTAQIIDGKAISAEIREELKERVAKLKDEFGKVSPL